MSKKDRDGAQDEVDALDDEAAEETDAEEGDFEDGDEDAEIEEFDDEVEDDGEDDIDAVVELSSKEQSAKTLAIRRALEERNESRRLKEDLDYLDFDLDD